MIEAKIIADTVLYTLSIALNIILVYKIGVLNKITPNPKTREKLGLLFYLGIALTVHEFFIFVFYAIYITQGTISLIHFKILATGSVSLITLFAIIMSLIYGKNKKLITLTDIILVLLLPYNTYNILIGDTLAYSNKFAAIQLATSFIFLVLYWILFFKNSYGQIKDTDPILKASAFGAYMSTISIFATLVFFVSARYFFSEPFNLFSTASSLTAFFGIYGLYINISPPDKLVRFFRGRTK